MAYILFVQGHLSLKRSVRLNGTPSERAKNVEVTVIYQSSYGVAFDVGHARESWIETGCLLEKFIVVHATRVV
jgi:hypothetical protein